MEDLSGKLHLRKDFSGKDLRGVPMHHARFVICNFKDSDISGNDCSYSDFSGSDLTNVNCNGTNFAHSKLCCKFYPKDAFGITITLECSTFRGMAISKLWWYAFVYFATMMCPEKDGDKNLVDNIIASLGMEKYIRLKKIFDQRQL